MAVEKTRCSGTKTEAGFRAHIKSVLRKGSRYWKPIQDAKKAARVGRKTNPDTGRQCYFATCFMCKEDFPESKVQVDHIEPVINPYTGFLTWDEVIDRMYCEVDNFQVLCKPCHTIKTNKEKQISKERTANAG